MLKTRSVRKLADVFISHSRKDAEIAKRFVVGLISDGSHSWAESFDGTLEYIFDLYERIARGARARMKLVCNSPQLEAVFHRAVRVVKRIRLQRSPIPKLGCASNI